MIRKTIFWTHLVCGVLAGLVIVTMSFTGVVLTYEQQILHWFEQDDYIPAGEQDERIPLERLAGIAGTIEPRLASASATVSREPGAPVVFSGGRRGPSLSLNPYTGEEMEVGSPAAESFFGFMTAFHRWFALEGDARGVARAITGASNLAFLFLILSGMYLWLPKVWKWAFFKTRLFFNPKTETAKARDFNWHHVFGIWSALPLAVVVATAAVFYYGWANDLVYVLAGDSPGEAAGEARANEQSNAGSAPAVEDFLSLDRLVAEAGAEIEGWRSITVDFPGEGAREVSLSVDRGNGRQPQLRHSLSLSRASGEVLDHTSFDEQPAGQAARIFVRYLHTGEVYGLIGQTIAGLVSLTSLLMVWTGLALAWRRLISPLLQKRGRRVD